MISNFRKTLYIISAMVIFSFCTEPAITTVELVDTERFMGTWYEIASLPTTYNKGCSCSKTDLEMESDKKYIRMINSCVKKNKQGAVLAKVYIQKGSGNSKMSVQMFWPFRSDYYIVAIATDYSYAMVCNPDKTSLQILSRQKFLEDKIFEELINKANILGFDTKAIIKTAQVCD